MLPLCNEPKRKQNFDNFQVLIKPIINWTFERSVLTDLRSVSVLRIQIEI